MAAAMPKLIAQAGFVINGDELRQAIPPEIEHITKPRKPKSVKAMPVPTTVDPAKDNAMFIIRKLLVSTMVWNI